MNVKKIDEEKDTRVTGGHLSVDVCRREGTKLYDSKEGRKEGSIRFFTVMNQK